jgi:adenine-specific DNA-methyltransferase
MPELQFKGKEFVYNHHLSVPYRPLVPVEALSVGGEEGAGLGGNLVIHGDNLHALKALLPLYAGKVDCVFIDPPYNTGNESWSYNDNVNSPVMREWLSSNPVNREDMLRHDKWLCMMYPRLKLLHELLSDRGSFWMTLDDNEVHRARAALDDIFGEENFVASVVWQKKYSTSNDNEGIAWTHDYVIVYRKGEGWERNFLERTAENDEQYRYEDERGVFRASDYTCNKTAEERPNLYYAVTNPHTGEEVWPNRTRVWAYSPEEHRRHVKEDLIFWGKDGTSRVPSYKRYRHLLRSGGGTVPQTWWPHLEVGNTDEAKKELREILPDLSGRDNTITPKPTRLVERVLQVATDRQSLVLDSFAGSGTTAQAVLSLNRKDDGRRRFVLVESEDYADRLTAERVRRVIKGYEFEGTRREELYRENVTLTTLKRPDKLLDKVAAVEQLDGHRFDSVRKEVKDGVLTVTGEKKVTGRAEGLGGAFTFCTLGEPVDLDGLLTGERLPPYESIGAWLFHTATGEALDPARVEESEWFLGESGGFHVWLVYRPDLDFLKSRDAALTLDLARKVAASRPGGKRHLVFAPARYVPNKSLLPLGVEYAPLPFALYRVEKG